VVGKGNIRSRIRYILTVYLNQSCFIINTGSDAHNTAKELALKASLR